MATSVPPVRQSRRAACRQSFVECASSAIAVLNVKAYAAHPARPTRGGTVAPPRGSRRSPPPVRRPARDRYRPDLVVIRPLRQSTASRRALSGSSDAGRRRKRPPDTQRRRNDRAGAWRSRARARLGRACASTEWTCLTAPARCPSRAAIPTPDSNLPEPATPKAALCQGRASASAGAANPCTARPRRGSSAAGSAGWGRRRARDTQHGQAVGSRSRLVARSWRLRRAPLINGSGCAAASIRGTGGAIPAWAPAMAGPLDRGRERSSRAR